jgi:O-antigen ligase
VIWKEIFKVSKKRPLIGFGYDVEQASSSFALGTSGSSKVIFENMQSKNKKLDIQSRLSIHNGYLSVLVGVGYPMLCIWIFLFLLPLRKIKALKSKSIFGDIYRIYFALFVMGSLSNFFEYTINGGRTIFSIIFWIFWALVLNTKLHIDSSTNQNYTKLQNEDSNRVTSFECKYGCRISTGSQL